MEIYKLQRTYKEKKTTGTIELKSGYILKTIELPYRNNTRYVSCIPEYTYLVMKCIPQHRYPVITRININQAGRDQFWWRIVDVKNREDIEIHQGETEKWSRGSILMPIQGLRKLLLETREKDFLLEIEKKTKKHDI